MYTIPKKKHVNIHIFGQVYKVGFRFLSMSKAYEERISGFVRNESDGSLYIEAEGEISCIDRFIRWCKQGPPGSKVEEILIDEGELVHYNSFDMQ
ncbi:MAG: acylphosphatase [Bacteroidales bacterium]|nr:acylphosphatase [Bacteroidales bacterium]MCF8456180.1 acylphosphatase [Bacteroidales bacterium]